MSYGRPSPRPGELYNRYAPPTPPIDNSSTYTRSEVGGTRPGRPPQPYPVAEPYYRGASSHPAQRLPGYAGSSHQAPGLPPSGRRYYIEPSRGYRGPESEYHSSLSRPSAMTGDRNPGFRNPQSSATRRPDARDRPQENPGYSCGLPRRGNRPTTPEEYYSDPDKAGQAQPQTHACTEAEGPWSWNALKKTVWGDSVTDASQSKGKPPPSENDQAPGDQNQENLMTIWTKLANVGASIQKKLNHDEGYASDATDYEGESHLTRIMKKYYVEKAESAYDLPDWLFSQAELKEAQREINESQYTNHAGNRPGRQAEPRRTGGRGGLDDIYATVDESRGGHARQNSKHSYDSGYGSSAEPPRRRRGRYEEEEEYAPQPRLREQMPARRSPPGQHAYNQPPPRQYQDHRRPPGRGPPPTTVDYFHPSGQNDRYHVPVGKANPPPPSSSSGRRHVR